MSSNKNNCQIININALNDLILSDYTSNSVFRTTWLSFKGCVDQYDNLHHIAKCKNNKEILLDFYKSAFIKAKEMKTKLTEYYSSDKDKEHIIRCNVNELLDKFLVINLSHMNLL
jgi:hypothetical protein